MITPEAAVQRCLDAYTRARALEGAANAVLGPYAKDRINRAYRQAMPFLTPGPDAIDAFLACVTHGLILEVFTPAEASKLLYATQVAITSRRTRTEAAREDTPPLRHSATSPLAAPPSPANQAGASQPQTEGAQTEGAPYLRTASPSGDVGNHKPQPATSQPPTPPSRTAAKPQLAAPQVPQMPN